MKIFYDEMTWPEVKEAANQNRVALVPVGSIEDHGWHLTTMTDNLIITEICNEAGRRSPKDIVVLPNAPYGFEAHHMDFPGSVDVHYTTLIRMWSDIGQSLAHHGFKKIVFLNGHGSNASALDLAAREVTILTSSACCMANWWTLVREEWAQLRESEFPGGCSHACEMETSLVMFLRPDLVNKDRIIKEIPPQKSKYMWRDIAKPSPVLFMDWFSKYTKSGQIGDASLATEEKGKKLFEMSVLKVVDLCKDFRNMEISERVDHQNSKEFPTNF